MDDNNFLFIVPLCLIMLLMPTCHDVEKTNQKLDAIIELLEKNDQYKNY